MRELGKTHVSDFGSSVLKWTQTRFPYPRPILFEENADKRLPKDIQRVDLLSGIISGSKCAYDAFGILPQEYRVFRAHVGTHIADALYNPHDYGTTGKAPTIFHLHSLEKLNDFYPSHWKNLLNERGNDALLTAYHQAQALAARMTLASAFEDLKTKGCGTEQVFNFVFRNKGHMMLQTPEVFFTTIEETPSVVNLRNEIAVYRQAAFADH